MSCSNSYPKEKQTVFRILGYSVQCNKINWANKGYTLTECDSRVKEIINATNIIIYE